MSFDLKLLNGDFVFSNGDFVQVTGTDKLAQDIIKICLTEVGANSLNPWYGSLISKTMVGSSLSSSILISMAQSQLQNSIQNLQKLQVQQQTQTYQQVSPDEVISAITNISVVRNSVDPRLFNVVVFVLSRAFTRVSTSFSI